MNSSMPTKFQKACVVGLGYVGLPTAALMAKYGLSVIGFDVKQEIVDSINRGEATSIEPNLDDLVKESIASGRLKATSVPEISDVFVICVPTPFIANHVPDLSYLEQAVGSLAPKISKANLIILESTSPVGTTEKIRDWLASLRPDLALPGISDNPDIHIAHSPERILPGHMLLELIENDRVIGGITPECAKVAALFYSIFVKGKCHITNARTAEFVKLSENAYRDINIAFANELSLVCDELNIDIWEARNLANHHPRVNILQPGPGVGGHCIAVDPWFIVNSAPKSTPLIQAARSVNDNKPITIIERIIRQANNRASKKISFLGLAYKADTDDLRESPAIKIVKKVAEKFGGQISVCEPNISLLPAPLRSYDQIILEAADKCLIEADIVVLLTDHIEFVDIPKKMLANKLVLDTRGLWQTFKKV